MLSLLTTMLHIKQLIFTSCDITEADAQFFVDFLKKADHHFCEIKLFETKTYWTYAKCEWKNRISGQIELLTWNNKLKEDRKELIELLVMDASMDAKLNIVYSESYVLVHELDTLHCSDDQKLWYGCILAAISYDNNTKHVSGGGGPNMLYSLIKKFPENLKVV